MKKVLVGLSGGVDSAVSAILLKEAGYEVIAITFKFIKDFDSTDAINIAKKLNIEHHIIDYQKEFKEEIIDKFLEDYKKGLTPNPCVLCNKKVKLKFLYDQLKVYNCDFIATGHYAKLENNKLYKGRDELKDQTYFLCETPKEILNKLLLPLEKITKEETRKIATKYDLDVANKKDSTDVCFISKKFKEYIKTAVKCTKGDIIDVDRKKVIGTHQGLVNYTIGQRRGLNIGGCTDRTFVVGKDLVKNILYVSIGNEENLLSDSCILEDVNWLSDKKNYECFAQFRYHSKFIPVKLEFLENNKIKVVYKNGVKSVTPGQICALYLDDECLGGGTIKNIRKNNQELWYQ